MTNVLPSAMWLRAEPEFSSNPRGERVPTPIRSSVLHLLNVALIIGGCAGISGCGPPLSCLCRPEGPILTVPAYSVAAVKRGPEAGAWRSDITPPPGYPTGGDGPAGSVARGYWTRLYARAFYLRDAEGHQLVMVSCDLFALPGGLKALVASRVAETGISPDEIILAATHTHQGPGNFMTARMYNDVGSQYPGFDETLLRFLAGQIATAIAGAIDDADKHNLDAVRLVLHRNDVSRLLLHNRAPQVFLLNWNRKMILDAFDDGDPLPPGNCRPLCPDPELACEAKKFWSYDGCPRLRAIDRSFKVLEILRGPSGAEKRIGALLFLAAHPTVLPGETPLYSSDFTGLAVKTLENHWRISDERPVVGFFNGAEGDINTRRPRRDLIDVEQHADLLASAVEEIMGFPGSDLTLDVDLRVDPGVFPEGPGPACASPNWPDVWISPTPQMGVAALGGGEGDRTVLRQLGWSDGVRGEQHAAEVLGQAPKQPGLDSPILRCFQLTAQFAPPSTFATTLPLTIARLGDPSKGTLEIFALPVEMTTTMAWDIAAKLSLNRERIAFVGLANEYDGYCTTPAEYSAQEYIGASTMWGQEEGPYIGCRLERLRRDPATTPRKSIAVLSFNPGPPPGKPFAPFGPSFVAPRRRPDEELDHLLRGADFLPRRNLPTFEWTEFPPSPKDCQSTSNPDSEFPSDFRATANRHVDVLDENGKVVAGEDDGKIVTVLLEAAPDFGPCANGRHWAAIWTNPEETKLQCRFQVTTGPCKKTTISSVLFNPAVQMQKEPQPVAALDPGASCPAQPPPCWRCRP
jgi:neutral ceramidase